MAKYINANRLRAEVERLYKQNEGDFDNGCYSEDQRCGYDIALLDLRMILDSLQQEQPDNVLIPRWCLENIENTLRIQYNINNDEKDGETCQDRNIKESLNCVRKLLNGEEITGRERLEPLMEQPDVDLEKEIDKEWKKCNPTDEGMGVETTNIHIEAFDIIARHFCEFGKNDMKKRMMKGAVEGLFWNTPFPTIFLDDRKNYNFKDNQKFRIIVVKEEEKQ